MKRATEAFGDLPLLYRVAGHGPQIKLTRSRPAEAEQAAALMDAVGLS
jgi:hypothetical protein